MGEFAKFSGGEPGGGFTPGADDLQPGPIQQAIDAAIERLVDKAIDEILTATEGNN